MAQRHPDPGLAVNGEGPATPCGQAWQALLLPAAPPPGSRGFPFRAAAQPATRASNQGDYRPGGVTGGREGLGGGGWGSHRGLGPVRAPPGLTETSGPPAGQAVRGWEARGEKDHPRAQLGAGRSPIQATPLSLGMSSVKHSLCLRHPVLGPLPERERPKADREETLEAEGGEGWSPGGMCPPDCPRGYWGRAGTCGQRLVGQKRGGGGGPGGWSSTERAVSTRAPQGLLQPRLLRAGGSPGPGGLPRPGLRLARERRECGSQPGGRRG